MFLFYFVSLSSVQFIKLYITKIGDPLILETSCQPSKEVGFQQDAEMGTGVAKGKVPIHRTKPGVAFMPCHLTTLF